MKGLQDWGLTIEAWRGQRGEYWVVGQAVLLLGFCLLPAYHPWPLPTASWPMGLVWVGSLLLGSVAFVFLLKGLLDLGSNLTPLPYPKETGVLVRSGVYGFVRHPLYSGLVLAALSWAIAQLSLSHGLATLVLFGFFDRKANREEAWLTQKYPDYEEYRHQVKKLIPWIY